MDRAGFFALIFFGLLAFFNAVRHPFVHDDVVFILKNPHITDLNHWVEAFKIPAASDGINTYYRPILEILYRLEYHFFGFHPFGYHLFNIIVHIVNGLLLFGLLKKFGLSRHVAWVIACIFLIHPVQTESVCCIAGISNLWMALGILLALHAYLRKWHIAALLCFVMAFLSKEQAVMFVPLVMVIDYYRKEKNYLSWFFWIVAACILLWLRQSVTGASLLKDIMVSPGELYLRLACIPRVIGMDLRLIFFPYDLHYYRSTDILHSNTISWVLALISMGGIFYIFKRFSQGRLTLILGFGWFLASLSPVLNIAPLINEYSFILTAEHFLYLPIVGILIVVVVAADYFLKHFKKLLLGIVISSCLLLTWYQNTFWNSEIALFERMLRFEPNFGRGHLLLAKAYYFNGQPQQANEHFEKAFTIMTSYAKRTTNPTAERFYLSFVKEILFDWAQNDSAMGQWRQALDKYKQESAIGGDAAMYNNMAFVYLHLGDKKDAYLSLVQALRIDPSFTQARRNLQALIPDAPPSPP
jgi:protein O-mannosyl-transferase